MIEIVLHGPKISVVDLDDGDKALIFVDDESSITVTTQLRGDVPEQLAAALADAGIEIARHLPNGGGPGG